MRALLAVLFLLVVGVVCLGFYQGWFQFSSNKSDDGTRHYDLTVHQKKILEDEQALKNKVRGKE